MSRALILEGARVIDPVNGTDEIRTIAIADGMIVPTEGLAGAQRCNLAGKVIVPGLIDMHVHFREPGQTHKEDIASGTRAAAAGGFTTVLAMPNTSPAVDSTDALREICDLNKKNGIVHVLQSATLTVGRGGQQLVDAESLKRTGAIALTDDGSTIQDPRLMLKALQMARISLLPIIDHCEDELLAGEGVIHDGQVAKQLDVPGKNRASEENIVARDIVLAKEADWPVHVQHISSQGSVALVRFAQRQGIQVTAEATPHHICLTDEAVLKHGSNAKMNPPLREEFDRTAIVEGLCDGTISAIATDHAPHAVSEKDLSLQQAPFGIIGLETALPLCLTTLYHRGILGLSDLIAKFTKGPRSILGLSCGSLSLNSVADITVIDLNLEFEIDTDRFYSQSRNSPFNGWKCRGKAVATMVAGNWVYSEVPSIKASIT